MGKLGFLKMKTDEASNFMIESDFRELGIAAQKLANHAFEMGLGVGFGTTFFKFFAAVAAILPSVVFSFLRGEVGNWIAFVTIVLRLFFPRHFPDWLEMPGSLILLLVVAPGFFADTLRGNIGGVLICLGIACYLLQEHIRASGGFRNSFTQSKGISNSIGIILLMVFPVWALVLNFL